MRNEASVQINKLIEALGSDDPDERIMAANILGEIGDEAALQALRERLRVVNPNWSRSPVPSAS